MMMTTSWLCLKAYIWDVLLSSAVLRDRSVLLSHLIPQRGEAISHIRLTDASPNSLWTLAAADMDKLSGLLGDGVVGDMVEEQIREKAADVAGETRSDK